MLYNSNVNTRVSSSLFVVPTTHNGLFRFSNSGLDLLLRRIAEGVRPSRKKSATTAVVEPAEPRPSSTPIRHHGNKNEDKDGDDDTDDGNNDCDRQLPRLNPSCLSGSDEGEVEGARQTMTVPPGKSDLLTVVGANNRTTSLCGKSQGQHSIAEGAVNEKGESAPKVVAGYLLSSRTEEEPVEGPMHKQRPQGAEQGRTTVAAPSPAATGGTTVKRVASRALCAMGAAADVNRGPVISGLDPSGVAFGNQRKAVFRRAAVGEGLTSSGDKENRREAAGIILGLR